MLFSQCATEPLKLLAIALMVIRSSTPAMGWYARASIDIE